MMLYVQDPEYLRNTFAPQEIGENLRIYLPSGMTVGIEIEATGELKEIDFTRLDLENETDILMGWEAKGETTVDNGIEIVSPRLSGTKQESKDIYAICSALTQLGETTSSQCGGHIHIGADYLTSKKSYVNLLVLWSNTEKILYEISNPPGELPRLGVSEYASPISGKVEEAIAKGTINLETEEDLKVFTTKLKSIQKSNKNFSLNFLNVNNIEKRTLEFRLSNGTLNPQTWIENINLFAGIVKVSEDLAQIQQKPEQDRTTYELEKLKMFEKLGTEGLTERQMLDILLSLAVPPEKKQIYEERYEVNSKLVESSSKMQNIFEKGLASRIITIPKVKKTEGVANTGETSELEQG